MSSQDIVERIKDRWFDPDRNDLTIAQARKDIFDLLDISAQPALFKEKLTIEPGEILVARVPDETEEEEVHDLVHALKSTFPENAILVLFGDVQLGTVEKIKS